MLNDKDAYNAFLHSLDEVRRLDKVSAYNCIVSFLDKDVGINYCVNDSYIYLIGRSWTMVLQIGENLRGLGLVLG